MIGHHPQHSQPLLRDEHLGGMCGEKDTIAKDADLDFEVNIGMSECCGQYKLQEVFLHRPHKPQNALRSK